MSESDAAADERAHRGEILLALARGSVARALRLGEESVVDRRDEPWLAAPGATFVTLMQGEALRGCIGTLEADRPLAEDVRANARAAAFRDPRFAPVTRQDFAWIRFEVSLLAPALPLPPFVSEEEALAELRPGVDGVIFEHYGLRSTFLPQVWEQIPDPHQFLAQLKRKAGLPAATPWSREMRLSVYEVEKWKEEGE
jgi:AmmeMemoRadiSam system protein A